MKQTKGSGIIFSIVLLLAILATAVILSSITVLETKMIQKTKSSVGAFYNAEGGVEWALNKIASSNGVLSGTFTGLIAPNSDGSVTCPNTDCKVFFLKNDGSVVSQAEFSTMTFNDIASVRSVGKNESGEVTQRAIEATVAEESEVLCGGTWLTSPIDIHTVPDDAYSEGNSSWIFLNAWQTFNLPDISVIPESAEAVILKATISNTSITGSGLKYEIRKDASSQIWYLLDNQNSSLSVGSELSSTGFFPFNTSNRTIQFKFYPTGSVITVNGYIKLSIIGYSEYSSNCP